jgi:hypothetical protein
MFNPGDYIIERLRYAKDFKIYPPVDANFRYETLSDDPRTLDDKIVQDMPRVPHYINKPPNKLHMIRGDFDNSPPIDITNFGPRPLRGGINGIPKKNRQPPHPQGVHDDSLIRFFKKDSAARCCTLGELEVYVKLKNKEEYLCLLIGNGFDWTNI